MSHSPLPVFPEQCNSLLKKYLTQELWGTLSERKTQSGYTFLQLINSGLTQPDSDIGVYAGDAESYTLFAPPANTDYSGIPRQRRKPPCPGFLI